jgi:hypothetical protein
MPKQNPFAVLAALAVIDGMTALYVALGDSMSIDECAGGPGRGGFGDGDARSVPVGGECGGTGAAAAPWSGAGSASRRSEHDDSRLTLLSRGYNR